jgi:hypothetical protein
MFKDFVGLALPTNLHHHEHFNLLKYFPMCIIDYNAVIHKIKFSRINKSFATPKNPLNPTNYNGSSVSDLFYDFFFLQF